MSLALDNATVVRSGRAILDQARFVCEAGRFTALCGPNGAGKTTAMSLLSGAVKADAGRALLDDQDVRSLKPAMLARRRAVVAQSSVLSFPFHVHEVVAMGRTPHQRGAYSKRDDVIVAAAIDAVELAPLAERNFMTLSGGERQRVHIARALAQVWDPVGERARWLLLDEPTAALDLKHQIALMALLKRLASEGWGVVAVLHDLHLVHSHADAVVLFKDGRVAAQGATAERLTAERVQDVFDLAEPYAVA